MESNLHFSHSHLAQKWIQLHVPTSNQHSENMPYELGVYTCKELNPHKFLQVFFSACNKVDILKMHVVPLRKTRGSVYCDSGLCGPGGTKDTLPIHKFVHVFVERWGWSVTIKKGPSRLGGNLYFFETCGWKFYKN